ncbi:MAG: N-acetylmuramoyl-L-alanine amidase [Chitinophagaceae bacterium]
MLAITYYFLQVVLCSAIMMGYYVLVLRNKRFHQYNRFYLLSVAIVPWIIPLIKITIEKPSNNWQQAPINFVSFIADNNSYIEQSVVANENFFSWDVALLTFYSAISCLLFVTFIVGLIKVWKLLKHNSYKHFGDFLLVFTKADGTPFSFFKFIFWNTDIDMNTTTGKQMLQHEITHVTEKHSVDKLLLQCLLIIGWPNPIFWLLKKELNLIHEFIADNKAISNGSSESLAALLLTAAYPKQQFILSNPFFYSPIKRRIMMLSKNQQHPTFSYIRRLIALPLLACITLLFAFRTKDVNTTEVSFEKVIDKVVNAVCNTIEAPSTNTFTPYHFKQNYVVVIDAGHGGYDGGAIDIVSQAKEKEITLAIAKLIEKQNKNNQIKIILTRNDDKYLHPTERVSLTNSMNADLLISLHCNAAKDATEKGIVVFVSNKERSRNFEGSAQLASAVIGALSELKTSVKGVINQETGIWLLQNTDCASTLVECGYMSNELDAKKLSKKEYQEKMANALLHGIETFLKNKETNKIPKTFLLKDTVPTLKMEEKVIIQSMHIEGKNGNTIDIKVPIEVVKKGKGNIIPDSILYILDNKEVTATSIKNLNPNLIESVNVFKGETAKLMYGEKGKNGVIEIRLKKEIREERKWIEIPIEKADSVKKVTLNLQ